MTLPTRPLSWTVRRSGIFPVCAGGSGAGEAGDGAGGGEEQAVGRAGHDRGAAAAAQGCTTISLDDRPGDWTELDLDVCWTRDGLLEVAADIGVASACEVDHGTHYVRQFSRTVADGLPLAEAFEQATVQAIAWTSGPNDPNLLRAGAGLPSPTA
ncbi:hypothetical protein GCM10009664_63560 [Kitasatospora gansuensis]